MIELPASPPRMGITPSQLEALNFIISFIEVNGYSPSYDEICKRLGLASKSGVQRLLVSLQERGCVRMKRNRSRSVYPTEEYLSSRRNAEIDKIVRRIGSERALNLLGVAR